MTWVQVIPALLTLLNTIIVSMAKEEEGSGTNGEKRNSVVDLAVSSARLIGLDITSEEIDELIVIALKIIKRNAKLGERRRR